VAFLQHVACCNGATYEHANCLDASHACKLLLTATTVSAKVCGSQHHLPNTALPCLLFCLLFCLLQSCLEQEPACASNVAAVDAAVGAAAPLEVSLQAQTAGSQQQQQQPELLSREVLKSIKAGRRRFLKHQAMVDGSLEVMDSPPRHCASLGSPEPGDAAAGRSAQRRAKQQLQPTYVVEAVADLLLDELLFGQVDELEGFCDALCSQLFEEEFVEA
jgi:hypothetical protein